MGFNETLLHNVTIQMSMLLSQLLEWLDNIYIYCALQVVLTFFVTSVSAIYSRRRKTPGEAPVVPYVIPYLGSTLSFTLNLLSFVRHVSSKYRDYPVRITLGPEKIFISGAQNIQHLFSRPKEVSTKSLTLMSLVTAFGMSSQDAKIRDADDFGLYLKPSPGSNVPPEKRIFHLTHHGYTAWLTSAELAELSRQFFRNFQLRIDIKSKEIGEEWHSLPDIFYFVKRETFIATTTALCGEEFLKLNPSFINEFWEFDSWLLTRMKRVPRWLVPKAYKVRGKLHGNIMKWHAWAKDQVDPADENVKNVLWEPVWGAMMMRGRAAIYKEVQEFSASGHAPSNLGMIWGANANVIPAAGWSSLYVLADNTPTTRIRAEIEHAFSSKSADSTSVTLDLKFGKYIVQKGKLILSSIYFSHRDTSIWNEGCTLLNGKKEHPLDTFLAERFLNYLDDPFSGPIKTPSLSPLSPSTPFIETKDPTPITTSLIPDGQQPKFSLDRLKGVYIPFGGGTNMCHGRHYAKNEMLLVVAMLLWAFNSRYWI